MDSSLMYRGLPGGPTKIKFAEELPRHCLCGHCGMITLSMYQDPDNHMFCDDCLLEQSTKHGVYHIFCSYESRNIAIHEMFEARDLITIIRDQYVECPNKPHCKEYMPLGNLREHYVSCKKLVECPSCGESIETEKWNGHRCPSENEQAVSKAKEKNGASMKLVQDPKSKGNQKRLVLHPLQTHYETRAYQRHCDRQALNIYTSPSETLGQAEPAVPRREWQVTCDTRGTAPSVQNSNGENHGPEATSLCQYCQRKMHFHECDRNPDNIPECISSELEAGDVSNPPQSNDLDETAVATNRSLSIGDGAIWLCHLASGDWLGAFVAMEESFKATKFDQHVRYAYLSQAFVGLKELSDEAMNYLSSFPIFVDGVDHQEAGENSLCGEEYKPYPLPELDSISEEPQRSRGEAHGGKKATKKETSKPDSEDEAPSPAESGTLFQEDDDKAGAKLGADERARNENADRTVYLNTSPEPSVRRALRTGSSSNSIANACTTSDRDLLLSVIAGTASEVNDHALVTADVPHEVKGHRQQQDRTGAERNCSPLVADVPVLPVLDVSHAELLEWYIAVQKHLRQLGVFDDTEKFELVSSFLSHCVLNQLADVLTSPPPTHAYECLLIALFRRSKSARSGCEDAFSCDQFLEELPYELAIKLLECEAAMEYIATSSVTVEESGCGSNDREMLFGDADTYFH
ncbi:hypothetical protein MRX96_040245 [Rhipicephalus microplus]